MTSPTASAATTAVFDAGLRAYMLRVYNTMAGGLAVSGLVVVMLVLVVFGGLVVMFDGVFAHVCAPGLAV